ncbi:hypothetical protein BJ875DRAFT_540806, partial [Amylocarpus encephaloides]
MPFCKLQHHGFGISTSIYSACSLQKMHALWLAHGVPSSRNLLEVTKPFWDKLHSRAQSPESRVKTGQLRKASGRGIKLDVVDDPMDPSGGHSVITPNIDMVKRQTAVLLSPDSSVLKSEDGSRVCVTSHRPASAARHGLIAGGVVVSSAAQEGTSDERRASKPSFSMSPRVHDFHGNTSCPKGTLEEDSDASRRRDIHGSPILGSAMAAFSVLGMKRHDTVSSSDVEGDEYSGPYERTKLQRAVVVAAVEEVVVVVMVVVARVGEGPAKDSGSSSWILRPASRLARRLADCPTSDPSRAEAKNVTLESRASPGSLQLHPSLRLISDSTPPPHHLHHRSSTTKLASGEREDHPSSIPLCVVPPPASHPNLSSYPFSTSPHPGTPVAVQSQPSRTVQSCCVGNSAESAPASDRPLAAPTFTFYVVRFTSRVLCFTLYGLRIPVYASRFTHHAQEHAAHSSHFTLSSPTHHSLVDSSAAPVLDPFPIPNLNLPAPLVHPSSSPLPRPHTHPRTSTHTPHARCFASPSLLLFAFPDSLASSHHANLNPALRDQ